MQMTIIRNTLSVTQSFLVFYIVLYFTLKAVRFSDSESERAKAS